MYRIETERGDLFDVNMMIAMQITVSGTASETALAESFRDTVKAFEILNCKIVIDADGNACYDRCDGSANSITFGAYDFFELITAQERVRFRLEDGEFLRCFLSQSDSGRMRIAFLMHHLGGDGKSLCYFIEAFLNRLNGEKCEYRKAVLLNRETLPKDLKLPLWATLLVNSYNRRWRKERRVFDFDDLSAAYQGFWRTHRTVTRVEVTESEALREKQNACRANGIGFTSYTIAERIQNDAAWQDVGLAVDGRQDGNRTMSNQATGISVRYRYDPKKTLVQNASVIQRKMKRKLQNNRYKYFVLQFMGAFDPTLVDAVNLEFAGYFHSKTSAKLARLLGYGYHTKDLSITNLTRLDIPTRYGEYRLTDCIFVPPVVSYGKNIIGMVTVDGHLNTTCHRYLP